MSTVEQVFDEIQRETSKRAILVVPLRRAVAYTAFYYVGCLKARQQGALVAASKSDII